MPFQAGKESKVIVAQFGLTSDLTQYNWGKSWALPNVTTFGNDDKVFISGQGEGRISVQGVWNNAANQSDIVLASTLDGVESVITASPQGIAAIGDRAHMVNGFVENYQPRSPHNDAVRFSSGIRASAGAYLGVILHPDVQRTTPANYSSVDQTALSSNGATAFLHVTQFAGTTATVTIEDSPDNAIWGSLVAFTAVTGVGQQIRRPADTGATVERFVRVALTGTFTSITFTVSFHRHRR